VQQAMIFLPGGGQAGKDVTWTLAVRHGADEAHESRATEELGHEHGRVSLCVCVLNPLQTWPEYTRIAAPLAQHATSIAAHVFFVVVVVVFFFFLFCLFFFQKLQSPQNAKNKNPVSDPSSRRLPQISGDLGFSHTAGSCRGWL
jgi:hypothetical protein